MKKIKFHVNNCNQYKTIEYGYKIDEETVYSKLDGEYTITHLKTGMRISSGKTLKEAKEKAVKLFAERGEIAKKNIERYDVSKLPLKECLLSMQNEVVQLLDLRSFPLDNFVAIHTGKFLIDILQLDNILMKRKNYDNELSMKENLKNMFGDRGLYLVEKLSTI